MKRGWTNSQKKPVANRDLWEPLIDVYRERGDISFRWVKGHSDDPMNDLVDRLAVEAALTQKGRAGTGRPAGLGPPDMAPARAAKGPALPEGCAVAVFGVRPPELGGYGPNATADRARSRFCPPEAIARDEPSPAMRETQAAASPTSAVRPFVQRSSRIWLARSK